MFPWQELNSSKLPGISEFTNNAEEDLAQRDADCTVPKQREGASRQNVQGL